MRNKRDSVLVNTVLEYNRNRGVDALKLQKLLYFITAHYVVESDGETLMNEPFYIWKYGPVIPSVYHEFKRYGKNTITSMSKHYGEDKSYVYDRKNSANYKKLRSIYHISEKYKDYSGTDMSVLTHAKGSPWDIGDNLGDEISIGRIKEYFSKPENHIFIR